MSNSIAEKLALDLAGVCGKLRALVEWCTENDGECLGDNPHQLAYAKRVLAEARAVYPPPMAPEVEQ